MKILTDFFGEKRILAVLSHGGQMYPLQILNEVNRNRRISLDLGHMFYMLNRLEKKGLVKSELGEEQEFAGFKGKRRYYKLVNQV